MQVLRVRLGFNNACCPFVQLTLQFLAKYLTRQNATNIPLSDLPPSCTRTISVWRFFLMRWRFSPSVWRFSSSVWRFFLLLSLCSTIATLTSGAAAEFPPWWNAMSACANVTRLDLVWLPEWIRRCLDRSILALQIFADSKMQSVSIWEITCT